MLIKIGVFCVTVCLSMMATAGGYPSPYGFRNSVGTSIPAVAAGIALGATVSGSGSGKRPVQQAGAGSSVLYEMPDWQDRLKEPLLVRTVVVDLSDSSQGKSLFEIFQIGQSDKEWHKSVVILKVTRIEGVLVRGDGRNSYGMMWFDYIERQHVVSK